MKKLFKYLIRSILAVVALVLIYLLSAFCLSAITIDKEVTSTQDILIFIKTNGVHTDIVVPVKTQQLNWDTQIKFSNTTLNDTTMQLLALGWGDKGFYLETPTWAALKFKTAFKAAFGLSQTVIHATFYKSLKESASCKKMLISQEQYSRLCNFILGSLKKDSGGHAIYVNTKANYNERDAFYEAQGSYSLFRTCNTWANDALKISGQVCCLWTPFDTGIFSKYQ